MRKTLGERVQGYDDKQRLQCYLLTVVPDHRPHQLLSAVKLVLHLEEGQSEDTKHKTQIQLHITPERTTFVLTGPNNTFPLPKNVV